MYRTANHACSTAAIELLMQILDLVVRGLNLDGLTSNACKNACFEYVRESNGPTV